ncbi:MAG: hypothetical protein HZB55_07350 [Deltaproteobacteria bacterium]|nr:hypothetical protein [Deltaproteobacteria bacterium]
MRFSTLAALPSGVGSPPAEVLVASGWGPAPGRQFRAVRYLGFSCGSLAEAIVLAPATAALRGEFLSLDYDALHPPAPLAPAEVREEGGLLVVELGGARRVRRIVFARSARTRDGTLGLFRLDGDRPAAEPSVTVEAGLAVAGIELEAEAPVLRAPAGLDLRPRAGRSAAPPGHDVAHETAQETAESASWHVRDTVIFELGDDFDDARFALRVTTGGGVSSLGAGDLVAVTVRSTPVNVRLGLAALPPEPEEPGADALADLLLFWPDPTSPPAPPTTEVDAGALLASALATHLSRRVEELRAAGAALPTRVDVALVAAADAPCRLRFDALQVDYHLERASLEPPQEKVVLRFPPDRLEAQEVAVLVPRGASVVSAQVEVSESRVGAGGGSGAAGTTGPLPTQGGLAVDESGWAAQRLNLADPVLATGLSLGLLPLSESAEVVAEVRAEVDGAPTGGRLAGGTVALGGAGRALWATVDLGERVLVPSGALWVCLRAARGRAVWLAGTWGAAVEAARVSAGDEEAAVLRGADVLCSLRTGSAGSAAAGAGLGLEVAGQSVAAGVPANGRVLFDVSAALSAAAAQPGSGPVTAVLRFTAQPGVLLTVYPPRVAYDL